MKINGDNTIPYPVEQVWAALLDPAVLVRTIPGCERLETTGEHTYAMTVTAGVAAIRGTYDGTCALSDLAEHESLVMRLQGAGAKATFTVASIVPGATARPGSPTTRTRSSVAWSAASGSGCSARCRSGWPASSSATWRARSEVGRRCPVARRVSFRVPARVATRVSPGPRPGRPGRSGRSSPHPHAPPRPSRTSSRGSPSAPGSCSSGSSRAACSAVAAGERRGCRIHRLRGESGASWPLQRPRSIRKGQ
jgi:carbon monoxide dehydrogenase subunit G